jgi:hypothetical protein
MSEPDFIYQNGELLDGDARIAWFHRVAREAHQKGANHVRYSVHSWIEGLSIVEAWREPPKDWDYGEPRFGLTAENPAERP